MGIEQELESIREGLAAGRFTNEAAVSQGIVLRLLHALSWPAYDTQVVWPEYSMSGKRVDFALCHPPGKPISLIEVKDVGAVLGTKKIGGGSWMAACPAIAKMRACFKKYVYAGF